MAKTWFDDGTPVSMTLGELIRLMVDGGDVAAVVRVVNQTPSDDNGNFCLTLEVKLMPNGCVKEQLDELFSQHPELKIHKDLATMIQRGLIK